MHSKACFQGFFVVMTMYINELIWTDTNVLPMSFGEKIKPSQGCKP